MEQEQCLIDLSGHYAIETWMKVDEIIKPFSTKMSFNYFSYTKIFNDSSRIVLTNNPHFILDYYQLGAHSSERLNLSTVQLGLSYRTWEFLGDTLDNRIATDHSIFNHISYLIKQKACTEMFHFGSLKDKTPQEALYLNNTRIIWKFIFYFRERARSLIEEAEKILLNPKCKLDFSTKNIEVKLQDNTNDLKRLYLGEDYPGKYLTKKEIEVVKWLAIGKTAEEIAIILSSSKRTVETHITVIKEKLNCITLFQLGNKINQLSLLDAIE